MGKKADCKHAPSKRGGHAIGAGDFVHITTACTKCGKTIHQKKRRGKIVKDWHSLGG